LELEALRTVPLLPVLSLTWVENYGVSMGLLQAEGWMRWVLVAVTAGIALAVAGWIWRERERWELLALGLVLGGALGNIVDRVRFGYVVDFVHLHTSLRPDAWSFYVFNVADAAISGGVAVLLARALWAPREKIA
jgi:signal peptidase II